MIATLRGTVQKGKPGELTVDVQGVGYRVLSPIDVWEALPENAEQLLHVFTYVREDRLDLFGFITKETKTLFLRLIDLPGIGPKTALELCAVPRHLLLFAIEKQDYKILSQVKGVGKKTAERLLVELKVLLEREPDIFGPQSSKIKTQRSNIDNDAIDALQQFGFKTAQILHALESLPNDVKTTEERVTAALRSL